MDSTATQEDTPTTPDRKNSTAATSSDDTIPVRSFHFYTCDYLYVYKLIFMYVYIYIYIDRCSLVWTRFINLHPS